MIAEHAFWITSRAAGIAALPACTAAVALGLLMSTRLRRSADFRPLHEALALATSGIGAAAGSTVAAAAHHLLDPATALAPTALEAEIRAKAAVLSGPDGALAWLAHGGVLVLEDRSRVIVPAAQGAPSTASARLA